jgi:LPS-assembly lipoprotein
MWSPDFDRWTGLKAALRIGVVFVAASLTAGCWQPLYSSNPAPNTEGVQEKFAAVDIPLIPSLRGTPNERLAVSLRNALEFDLHNGAHAFAPTYTLRINLTGSQFTSYLDPTSGRPESQIEIVVAGYDLVELATGKVVVKDTSNAHVSYDIPGPQQRFAGQRARRDAEDHAIEVVAQAIRSRLASYFVAGT